MNLIIDKEADLATEDLLHTKVYADTLKEIILKSPKNESLTIGLFGPWGSGKSSIIKTLKAEIGYISTPVKAVDDKQIADDKLKIAFVVYDAWKYANDSFRRTFILNLQKELGVRETEGMKNFYKSSTQETGIESRVNTPFTLLVFFVLILAFLRLIYQPGWGETFTLAVLISFMTYTTGIFSKLFIELKRSVQTPVMSAPELFEQCFNELIVSVTAQPKEKQRKWFSKKETSFIAIDKIVIVIDNIDRCPKEGAYELLTNTKNFISSNQNVIFLMPVDEESLKKHLFKTDTNTAEQGEEFLRKYFNVIVRMKIFRNTEIFDFANSINNKKKIGLKKDTVNIIAREYAKNPRRIIQFYNNLTAEIEMMELKYSKGFSKANEAAICKLLIIREEWPDKYKQICTYPKHFLEQEPRNYLIEDGEEKPVLPESYEAFLDNTYVSTRNLKLVDLQKILLNADNYETLPEAIITVISTRDSKKIKLALDKDNLTKERVIDHLLFQLKAVIAKDLYDTDVSTTMHQLLNIMLSFPRTEKHYFEKLEHIANRSWNEIIPSTNSFDLLVEFNQFVIKKKKLTFVDKAIVDYYDNFEPKESREYHQSDFELYYDYILLADDEQTKKAQPFFSFFLERHTLEEKVISQLQDIQFDILYTRSVLETHFFTPGVIIWVDNYFKDWLILLKKLRSPEELIEILLGNAGRDLSNNIGASEQHISTFIDLLKAFPTSSGNAKSIEQLHLINDHIFIRKNNNILSFLESQVSSNNPYLFDYLLESYRFTMGSKSSAGWILEFFNIFQLSAYANAVTKFIIKYKNKIDFVELKTLVSLVDYIDENVHEMQLELLYISNDGVLLYLDSEISTFLYRLITNFETHPKYQSYLEIHASNPRGNAILQNMILDMNKPSEEKQSSFLLELLQKMQNFETKKKNI